MKNIKIFLFLLLIGTNLLFPQDNGALKGKIVHSENGEPIQFVNVILKETSIGVSTNYKGEYKLNNLKPGDYIIIASAVGHKKLEKKISINPGETVEINFEMENAPVDMGEVFVYGATLKKERFTESPASISVINHETIQRKSSHGQIAKLLEHEPGMDVVQSGLFDFNINSRGFNSSLNRRLLILLDGRDLGTAFLGATEWNGLSTPLEDLGRIELVRGPGSALYGANAFNGVINITSMSPKSNPGTRISVGGGELNAMRGDLTHSGINGKIGYRINLGGYQGNSFSKDRYKRNPDNNPFEYDQFSYYLNNEVVHLSTDPVRTLYASGRVDYDFTDNRNLTLEGGLAQVENEVIVTGIGRVQVAKAQRPWGRLNYNGDGFNLLVWTNIRKNIEPEKSLSTGLDLIQNASVTHGEIQYNFNLFNDKLFIVTGTSYRIVSIDTKGTLMEEPRDDNSSGIFGQAEYEILNNLKFVFALRWDRSTLYSPRFSPKAAFVYTPFENHNFRFTYNQAFQTPNYSEQYLYVNHPTSAIVYRGNPDLVPEEITGFEIGYKGILSNQLFVTVDGYLNMLSNFVTDLGPSVNPKYKDPIILPGETFSRQVWSYANAGKVEEYGGEVAANYYLSDDWLIDANLSIFQFKIIEQEQNDVLLPNTPEYKINIGLTYFHPRKHSASINFKYIPEYLWAAGIFRGKNAEGGIIKSYFLVDLAATYIVSNLLSFNLNVSNLLDNEHYEILGGSLLGRRALLTASITFK